MDLEKVKSDILSGTGSVSLKTVRQSLLVENPKDLTAVAKFLKESPDYQMDYLSSATAADYLDYLETVYHLYSMAKKHGPVVLRVRVKRDDPKCPSLVPLYRGAEFQERDNFDLFGIEYEGHPDLRRVMMWEGFDGFPMRKDYQQEDSETLEAEDVAWLDKNNVKVPEALRQKAEELKQQGKRAIAERRVEDKT